MYIPKHFLEARIEVLHAFIRRHPLATICIGDASGLEADHVPLTLRSEPAPHGVLLGHVARANPLWRKAGDGLDCLVVFQGPQHYISPGWYATKAETGRVVPTWNYEVVHVQGRVRAVDDPVWLRALLEDLTTEHERLQPQAWHVSDAPNDYVDAMVRAVVGIRIEILGLVGKAKLSQNQPESNQHSLIESLRAKDDSSASQMAEEIANRASRRP
jgi:transcriptional regulator